MTRELRPQEAGFAEVTQIIRNAMIELLRGKLEYPFHDSKAVGVGIGVDYGYTKMPNGSGYRFHKGIDMNGRKGKPVVATEEGEVIFSGEYSKDYGNTVKIRHEIGLPDGSIQPYFSVYAHNSEL